MSKRSDEKEKLARKLDAGEISEQIYNERIARLGQRGHAAQERHRAAQKLARTPVEWSPRAQPTMTLAEKLKAARAKAGLTQAETDALCGLGKGTIASWESGRYTPHPFMSDGVLAELARPKRNSAPTRHHTDATE